MGAPSDSELASVELQFASTGALFLGSALRPSANYLHSSSFFQVSKGNNTYISRILGIHVKSVKSQFFDSDMGDGENTCLLSPLERKGVINTKHIELCF